MRRAYQVKNYEELVSEAGKCVRPGESQVLTGLQTPSRLPSLKEFCSDVMIMIGGVLLFTEGNLELQNESKTGGQDIAFGEGAPGHSWLARTLFGELGNRADIATILPLPCIAVDTLRSRHA